MQRAMALILPSLLKGFGLPVLEGFASQIPVICSNTSSLPEVAGGSALMFNPLSQSELSEAMLALVENPKIADDLILKGNNRAREMTWNACADKTYKIYKQVLGTA